MTATRAERSRILLIEDDCDHQDLIKKVLASSYEVTAHSNAEEALETLRETRFDLVICDINLMGMTGFTILETMKQDPKLREIPVLLCSAQFDPSTRAHASKLGASGFLTKPFHVDNLLQTVKDLTSG